MMSNYIKSPIFIIGCGRSGTTFLYETFAVHQDLAWISNWTDESGWPGLARFNKYFATSGSGSRFFPPRPSEGYKTWDRATRVTAARESYVGGSDLSPSEERAVKRFISQICGAQRAKAFLNKNTRNSRRIEMLNKLFPDAMFVHVYRNPLDTVSSLLRVHWWPNEQIWFKNGLTPEQLCHTDEDSARLAAELVVHERAAIERGRAAVEVDRWTDVRYEKFIADPQTTAAAVLERLGLPESSFVYQRAQKAHASSVGIHMRTLSHSQRAIATEVFKRSGVSHVGTDS